MFHEVNSSSAAIANLQDKRGLYSIINRRFTELTSGWQHYAVADAVESWNINQPQGVVTETILVACAYNANEDRHYVTYVKPTSFNTRSYSPWGIPASLVRPGVRDVFL